MAVSDYFALGFINCADDDGVYYMRQLDRSDGIEFEGLVWFGQYMQNEPGWANVFFGRLIRGAGTDAAGNRIDRWEGRFFDVPKGRNCGTGTLNLETVLVDNRTRAGCDFSEHYIRKTSGVAFGGTFWGIENTISGCADGIIPIPLLPPLVQAALFGSSGTRFVSVIGAVVRLGSVPLSPGFQSSTPGNLTGAYIGDDGGRYYVRHVPETRDVVWYGESADAQPPDGSVRPFTPARGWSNVFFGKLRGSRILGFWADVPRGAARGAGNMRLTVSGANTLRITSVTGGFGGRLLRRVQSINATLTAQTLTVVRANEGQDEPLIYLVFFKIDGDTVDFDRLSAGRASFFTPPSILVGDNVPAGTPLGIDPAFNHYTTVLSTLPSIGMDTATLTRIGVVAYAIEVDDGYSNEFRHSRFEGWRDSQIGFINNRIQSGIIPEIAEIRNNAQRILVRYLGPWSGWPWGDTDDIFSGDAAMFNFREIQDSFNAGRPVLETTLNFVNSSGNQYSIRVVLNISARLNPDCS